MSEQSNGYDRPRDVVIVGAGHAGGTAAACLRQYGFAGNITLIGDEAVAPYQRPPLSKAWLKGKATAETLLLRPAAFYDEHRISLRLGTRVDTIDRRQRAFVLADGSRIDYECLILATGARARAAPFPGAGLPRVLALRTCDDAERLKQSLKPHTRLVVVGGGYVGLEVAASAVAIGADAVVVERESRLLARVACPELSSFFLRYHSDHGIRFRLGQSVASVRAAGLERLQVHLDSGEIEPADIVLVGVGAIPNQELAQAAGLACENGLLVDAFARTEDPYIYGIGDCTQRPLSLYARTGRLESVPNAIEQAKQAAASICGRPAIPPEIPWFWSDQFDLKLQIAGLPFDVTEVVVRGDPDSNRFSVFHLNAERRIQAVEAVDSAPEFMMGRQLIAARRQVDVSRLRNPAISIKEVAI